MARSRRKAELETAAQKYVESLKVLFPEVELDNINLESVAGSNVWISFKAPVNLVFDILDEAAKLNSKWAEEKGILVLTTVRGTGPISTSAR